jgi:TetR/AcrR family transcriptional regulator, transcriptional repressor for nem operon
MRPKRNATTAARILDVAERLVQVRGFNAFSYADIAEVLDIRKASLHHHFATKTALGVALVTRYRRDFLAALESIEANGDRSIEQLEGYIALYRTVLRKRRMCMCGMLAADVATLPDPMRDGVAEFFRENEKWLTGVLAAGKKRGELRFAGSPAAMAAFFVSSLEGAMLVARGRDEPDHLDDVAGVLMAGVRLKTTKRAVSPARRR